MRAPICAWYNNWGRGDHWDEPVEPPKDEKPKDEKPKDETPEEKPAPKPEKKPSALHALVIGRFMPPHAGHQYLVDVARNLASTTTVLARTSERDAIAPSLRLSWLRELFGDRVGALVGDAPEAADTPAFWRTWADHVAAALARMPSAPPVDVVVSSDPNAWKLAELLGARHACVDPQRLAVPISATAIRRDPLAAWDYLPPPVRAHYAKRVVLLGPEGSGKSTFARALATALATVYVPEQARLFAARAGGMLRESQIAAIAELHEATITAAGRRANRYVIADTDALSLQLWCERLFHSTPPLAARAPDIYLVTDASVGPPTDERRAFAARCLEAAAASGAAVVRLPADPAARMAIARAAIADS